MQTATFELHAQLDTQHWWFRARGRIILQLVHKLVPPGPDQLVLEVGCGTGGALSMFAEEYRCCGVDPSEVAIAHARRRFPNVEFRLGRAPEDVMDLWARVRVVLLLDVLEHLEDDAAFLEKLVPPMAGGTYLVITVPADMRLWSPQDESYGHFRRYEQQTLARLCSGLPVTPVLVSYFNSRFYPVIRLVRAVNVLRRRPSGEAGADLFLPPGWVNSFLERVFAGEGRVLDQLLAGRRQKGYTRGVSLLAILRRNEDA
ncbi:MAG: methyltransferase domain-containing protein [Planctomycetota bacterium]|nr:methyltransferase domain-containing protein [Planctomycetota bacterium]